jgi:mRNA-degrading endonuclease toxin of MazEF toxin-antitoxin module
VPPFRLIVSADFVNANADLPVVLAVQMLDADPDSLLAVRVGEHGWARALSVEPIQRRRLVEHVDTAEAAAMEQLSTALRAVQEL